MAHPWQKEAAKRILFLFLLLLMKDLPVRASLITTASVAAFQGDYLVTLCAERGTQFASCETPGGSADAEASYVGVSAFAQASGSVDGISSEAYAAAQDRLTITGGTGSAILNIPFQAGADDGSGVSFLGFTCFGRGSGCFGDFVELRPFTFGVPFNMTMWAAASGSYPPAGPFRQGGYAFINLYPFTVADSQGRPIPNVQILAQSGTAYPFLTTPEPSTLILFASGLGLLFSIGRRRLIG